MEYSPIVSERKSRAWSVFPELEPVNEDETRSIRLKAGTKRALGDYVFPAPTGHIRATSISFADIHKYGDLFVNFMRARKEMFIDYLHWNLPQADGMEFDQYDTPLAKWIVIHEYGEILGGFRLMPTTAKVGLHTYMLKDAQEGLLQSIPTDVLFLPAPVSDTIWEASRLFIPNHVPAQRRHDVQIAIMENMTNRARELGAQFVIGIVPAVWSRWLRRLNLAAAAVGPRFVIDGTASQAALFNVAKPVN
jgi:acyl homoserine lactone synthase